MSATAERLSLGADSSLVPLTLWRSPLAHAPVILIVPALGTPAGAYRRLAQALATRCAEVAVLELRGVGESRIRPNRSSDWGYADLVDAELDAAIKTLRRHFPDRPLLILAHSLGGHLALLHQARHPQTRVDGLIFVASGAPFAPTYGNKRWLVRGFGWLANWSSRLFGYFPGDLLGFGGRQGQRLMREWARFVRTGQPQVDGWSDPQHWRVQLKQLQRPALALATAGDHYAPPKSVQHLLGLSSIKVPVQRIDERHQGKALGHFGWLRQPEAVVAPISGWVLDLVHGGQREAA